MILHMPRFFVAKHPCDNLPYVYGSDPDPQSEAPFFTFEGPDYSGWYISEKVLRDWILVLRPGLKERNREPELDGYGNALDDLEDFLGELKGGDV